eukprot:8629062-Alexandrium_andersonii.AAC.1
MMLAQPPRQPSPARPRSDGGAGPAFFRIRGDSHDGYGTPAPSRPKAYRAEQGVWGTPGTWVDAEDGDVRRRGRRQLHRDAERRRWCPR